MHMFIATAAADWESGPLNAYQRQFIRVDLDQAFKEAAPRPSDL